MVLWGDEYFLSANLMGKYFCLFLTWAELNILKALYALLKNKLLRKKNSPPPFKVKWKVPLN